MNTQKRYTAQEFSTLPEWAKRELFRLEGALIQCRKQLTRLDKTTTTNKEI